MVENAEVSVTFQNNLHLRERRTKITFLLNVSGTLGSSQPLFLLHRRGWQPRQSWREHQPGHALGKQLRVGCQLSSLLQVRLQSWDVSPGRNPHTKGLKLHGLFLGWSSGCCFCNQALQVWNTSGYELLLAFNSPAPQIFRLLWVRPVLILQLLLKLQHSYNSSTLNTSCNPALMTDVPALAWD